MLHLNLLLVSRDELQIFKVDFSVFFSSALNIFLSWKHETVSEHENLNFRFCGANSYFHVELPPQKEKIHYD